MRRPPLELDHFAPRARRPSWAGTSLLALSLCAAGMLAERYAEARGALERIEAADALAAAPRAAKAQPARLAEEQEKSARAAARQLALPWGALIEALESAASANVALLQVQPDAEQRVLRIVAEARDADAMFAYLQGLDAVNGLSDAHLVSHQLQKDHPQQPVRFAAQASFRRLR